MRPNWSVLLVRFLAKALLCPYYRWVVWVVCAQEGGG